MNAAIPTASPPATPPEPVAGNYFVAAYPPFSAWSADHVPACLEALEQPRTTGLGLYVHLPFCRWKCDYCYYFSYIAQPAAVVDRYLDTVCRELELYARHPGVAGRPISFAYFGGGTPSTLSSDQLRKLGDCLQCVLSWDAIEEVTFECAPRSVRDEFLEALREAGVTRLSMGVQSFDDHLLKLNGRVHLGSDVERAFGRLRAAGFDHVNLDLMCGMIGETEAQWHDSVRRMIALGPESVTIYQTEIPHNTKLYHDFKDGSLPVPPVSWDEKRARLDFGFRELEAAGYTVVSGYTAVKDPARHGFRYQEHLWFGDDMLGLGVAAFGYFGGFHLQNQVTIETYEAAVQAGEIPLKRALALTPRDRLVREFVLQLKLGHVAAAPFRERHGVELQQAFERPLRNLAAEGFLTCDEQGVHLTRAGLLRVDRLLPLFYDPQSRDRRYT